MKHSEDERGLLLVIQEVRQLMVLLEAGAQTPQWSLNEDRAVPCFVYRTQF